ncbi:H-X9-DG-CTERM domain-containing protein [Singulisphaera sp. Ch08]|uniref:H-X9-DG-CTERM domain-containing protein n=1 Tax=Singulisphaera sp. Ch08 TaxID=3120278 RepID=A0AAU7CK30_9BACT
MGLEHISDGTSQTAGVAEFCRGDWFGRDVTRLVLKSHSPGVAGDRLGRLVSECLKLELSEKNTDGAIKGVTWMSQALGQTLYNHTLPPNERSCTNDPGTIQEGAWTAGSQHPGGVNVLFLDGHVSFKRATILLSVWRAIGTMNNNEAISGEDN